MSGYVLDDLALIAGLATDGEEQHRRELSRLLIAAIERGPTVCVPALCLAAAAVRRPAMAGHLAELVVGGPVGAVEIVGLARTAEVAQLRAEHPGLEWPALHAISTATAGRVPIVTTAPGRYAGTIVEAIRL
ncbi:hypothetical protein ONA70_26750 [Micromonospora yasonensis]|uniref:hypothetical protein n=1 Tax=Micromonospora yasonensis TaxID=1128667 RepID=UPI002231B571|nr:hypothetical protein [Micromonospora yasonensis]MCW3843707.1 hypothetical protein [Micromonospora yasonensis]